MDTIIKLINVSCGLLGLTNSKQSNILFEKYLKYYTFFLILFGIASAAKIIASLPDYGNILETVLNYLLIVCVYLTVIMCWYCDLTVYKNEAKKMFVNLSDIDKMLELKGKQKRRIEIKAIVYFANMYLLSAFKNLLELSLNGIRVENLFLTIYGHGTIAFTLARFSSEIHYNTSRLKMVNWKLVKIGNEQSDVQFIRNELFEKSSGFQESNTMDIGPLIAAYYRIKQNVYILGNSYNTIVSNKNNFKNSPGTTAHDRGVLDLASFCFA